MTEIGKIMVKVDRTELDQMIKDVESFKVWADSFKVPWWWKPLKRVRIRCKLKMVRGGE